MNAECRRIWDSEAIWIGIGTAYCTRCCGQIKVMSILGIFNPHSFSSNMAFSFFIDLPINLFFIICAEESGRSIRCLIGVNEHPPG